MRNIWLFMHQEQIDSLKPGLPDMLPCGKVIKQDLQGFLIEQKKRERTGGYNDGCADEYITID